MAAAESWRPPPLSPRAKHLPLNEPRRPALSKRKKDARHDFADIVRECGQRWRLSERELADNSEVCKRVADDALDEMKPFPGEWIVMLDDVHGIEFADALKAFFQERRRRRLNHR